MSSCAALGRLETYLTEQEGDVSDLARPATQAALAASLPSSSSQTVFLILLLVFPAPQLGSGAACAAQTVSATMPSGSV